MFKLKNIMIFFMLIAPLRPYAQYLVNGKVAATSGKGIEFVNIVIKDSISQKYVNGAVTDSNGLYHFYLNKGRYVLRASIVGYQELTKSIMVNGETNLGKWSLIPSMNTLDLVTVTAKQPLIQRQIDRVVFNVKNSVVATGGDALDALQVSPGVRVNNDQIGIIGRSGVQIMVNNRIIHLSDDDLVNYLRSIKSDEISKIEIITNPPANYDADGNSGLINIVLRKAKLNQWDGSINTTFNQTTYPGGNLSWNFNFNKNNFSFTSSLAIGDILTSPSLKNSVFYPNQLWASSSQRKDTRKSLNGTLGLQYKLSKKSLISIQYIGETSSWKIRDNSRTNITSVEKNLLDSAIITNALTEIKDHSHSFNLHFENKIDTSGKTFTIDADYFTYDNNTDRTFFSTTTDQYNNADANSVLSSLNFSDQKVKIYTTNADFNLPVKWATFLLGGKISFIDNNSMVSGSQIYQESGNILFAQNDLFKYNENTQSIYASAKRTFNKTIEVKLGIRIENTQTRANSYSTANKSDFNYTKIFPTVYLMDQIDSSNLLSFSYGRRIGRPNYGNLNPFRYYSNTYAYSEGNPFLQPSFTDNFELTHTYRGNLSSVLYLSNTKNGYGQVTILQENTNIQQTVVRNYYTSHKAGLSENFTFNKVKWWESYNEFNIYYNKVKSTQLDLVPNLNGLSAYFSLSNSFSFNAKKSLSAAINYWYQFPEADALYKYKAYSQLDLGLKSSVTKSFQIAVNFRDVLKTSKQQSYSFSNNIEYQYNNYFDTRRMRISLIYKFGTNVNPEVKKHSGNEDERNRTD